MDGVDVLFIGPMDLSVSLGIPREFDHPKFKEATQKTLDAASRHGKACGILGFALEEIQPLFERGYTFVAVGSDGGMVSKGMSDLVSASKDARASLQ